jgi:hypothetical protein
MSAHRRLVRLLVILVAVAAVIATGIVLGLVRPIGSPPRPDRSLEPEIVSRVLRWAFIPDRCQTMRLSLEAGRTLDLVMLDSGTFVRCGDGPQTTGVPQLSAGFNLFGDAAMGDAIEHGGLLLYGHDRDREWLAGASAGSDGSVDCPFHIHGEGYDEGPILHFSSGLVLHKATSYHETRPWAAEGWFDGNADICVDERATALSIARFAQN